MSLPIEIQNSITRYYSLRQNEDARIDASRREEVYAAIPRYKELMDEISSQAVAYAKEKILTKANARSAAEFQAEQKKRAAFGRSLLLTNGYPEDYLEPHYFCLECKDTGMNGANKCHCYRQFVVDKLYQASNLPSIAEHNFDTLDLSLYPDHIRDDEGRSVRERMQFFVDFCRRYAENFSDQNADSLLISGLPGTSKTFLCSCIAKVVLDAGYSVVYLSAADVFEKIHRNTWNFDEEESSDMAMYELFDCDLLIIDDLGSEPETANTPNYFFRCINERLVRKHSTIISTNHSLDELQRIYTSRVFERITSAPYKGFCTTDGVKFNVRKGDAAY